MKLNKYDLILGLLIIAEIIICIYVGTSNGDDLICKPGSGCGEVQNSIYGTLFGIKLAWFGVICFFVFFLLFLMTRFDRKRYWMFFLASVIGTVFAIYFIALQVFVLKQLCRDCLIIDGIMVLMFIIVIFEFIDFRKGIREIEHRAKK